jgi:hypothetical protein
MRVFFTSNAWDNVVFKFGKPERELTKSERKALKAIRRQLRELWASFNEEA